MLRRLLLGLIGAVLLVPVTGGAARADVTCPAGYVPVGSYCLLDLESGGGEGDSGGGGSGSGGGGGSDTVRQCYSRGVEIGCTSTWGYWDAGRGCYVEPASPQPAKSDGVWDGKTDGLIYDCTVPGASVNYVSQFWSAAAPVTVSAAVLASQLREELPVSPVEIGIVPEPGPDSIGLIGLPTWLWVADPGPETWGPQTRSLSSGGVSVTLTAQVTSIRWEMGDGAVVRCSTPGTPYEDRFGAIPSPTCGHTYTQQGVYAVEATTFWTATWTSNTGESGVFEWQMGSSTTIQMGEAQALNQ